VVRDGGRTVIVHALLATGVNAADTGRSSACKSPTGEDGAGGLAFLRDLTARGLTGVKRVTSDAHRGLVDAIAGETTGKPWRST
jgi:putative transposase